MTRQEFDRQLLDAFSFIDEYYHQRYKNQYNADVLQETFTRVIENYQSWNPSRCKLSTWIIGILKNVHGSHVKYLRYHPEQTEKAYIPDGECYLHIMHDYDVIHAELCKLTFHQRRVIVCLMKGMKTGDMGRCFPKIKNPHHYKQSVNSVKGVVMRKLILAEAV